MEDEYEISTTDTAEGAKRVIDWIFSGSVVEKQFPNHWEQISHNVSCGALCVYRRKKPIKKQKKWLNEQKMNLRK